MPVRPGRIGSVQASRELSAHGAMVETSRWKRGAFARARGDRPGAAAMP